MSDQPSQPFNPAYTGLVDYDSTSGNFLFRGNLPLLSTSPYYFAYDELNQAMQALTAGITNSFDLSNYNLLVVTLLDNQGDYEDWELELGNFGASTAQFPTADWPPYQYISPWNPSTLLGNGSVTASSTETYSANILWWPFEPQFNELAGGFQFDGLVTWAKTTLVTPPASGQPSTVIYVHCDSGVNRTGAFTIAYLLQYGSSQYPGITTLEDAFNVADGMPQQQAPSPSYFPMLLGYSLLLDAAPQ